VYKFTKEELRAAYHVCLVVKSDKEFSAKAQKFVEAYERVGAYKLPKRRKDRTLIKTKPL
jgi:hypothetical protein